jgi:hypothetical protein
VFLAGGTDRPGLPAPPTQRKRRHPGNAATGAPGHDPRHPGLADRC